MGMRRFTRLAKGFSKKIKITPRWPQSMPCTNISDGSTKLGGYTYSPGRNTDTDADNQVDGCNRDFRQLIAEIDTSKLTRRSSSWKYALGWGTQPIDTSSAPGQPLADSSCLGLEKRIIRWPEVQIGNSVFNLNLS